MMKGLYDKNAFFLSVWITDEFIKIMLLSQFFKFYFQYTEYG